MERNRKLFLGKVAAIMSALPLLMWAYEYGPNPGFVQVPGENGGASCAAGSSGGSQCHATSASSFKTGSVTVNFPNGLTYTPGVKQHLSVTIADSDTSLKGWGFQLTARSGSPATTMAGTFNSSDANTLLECSDTAFHSFQQVNYSTSGSQTCPASQPLEYIEHSLQGFEATIGPNSATYQFDWTPPSSDVGNIVIYVAGNAGLGLPAIVTGDHVYTQKYTLTSQAAAAPPSIASGGVISAGSFGAFSSIAPGTWIEIYGTNLGPSTAVNWASSDFNNGVGPTSLGGTTVTIGGQPAYLDYVSTGQVNAQVPSSIGTGSQNIVVTTGGGASSAYPITVNATQAGLLAPPSFIVNGNQYVVAFHQTGAPCGISSGLCYVLPKGAISGLASAPAAAGEIITLYGIGFGAVTPNFPAGEIVTAANKLTSTLLVNYGSTPASVTCSSCYEGLGPNFVGLYQFNVQVPNVSSSGAVAFSFSLGGVAGSQTLFTAVQ
ncbi:MAG TPA: choice-of-anchor V domain-containing protein [Bryobacteraceae bacterium]|nr:choice-of-anchor V domain-containing protein [Bryobacteraceae bacterium]